MDIGERRIATVNSDNGEHKLVQFSVIEEDVEPTLILLQQYGIGNRDHTCISVIPASVHFEADDQTESKVCILVVQKNSSYYLVKERKLSKSNC